ncbi:MAG: phosphotransferase [Bacterioplanes sp.]|nr:phosphotransferase [Bacterioplanes sp.]
MDLRRSNLAQWAAETLTQETGFSVTPELTMVSGDASFRRYFRIHHGDYHWIAVDAPPDQEDSERFVRIAEHWYKHGVRVPRIIAFDAFHGYLLLEDFGDQWLWSALHAESEFSGVEALYQRAIEQLLPIQQLSGMALPQYDAGLLQQEMALFRDWLCVQQLGMTLSDEEQVLLQEAFDALTANALSQAQVVVHRDYHSRNLMVLADQQLGIIDFQDAVLGPATYDVVSLLRDCYVRWPDAEVKELAVYYWQKARTAGIYLADWDRFQQDFDWMGMQRHLKAAGIFARLSLRDGKDGYLASIPNTCRYIADISAHYEEFAKLHAWLTTQVLPRVDAMMAEHAVTQ